MDTMKSVDNFNFKKFQKTGVNSCPAAVGMNNMDMILKNKSC